MNNIHLILNTDEHQYNAAVMGSKDHNPVMIEKHCKFQGIKLFKQTLIDHFIMLKYIVVSDKTKFYQSLMLYYSQFEPWDEKWIY